MMAVTIIAVAPSLYGQNAPERIGGELTPNITWHIADNTLYLSGSGIVPTTMFATKSAWSDYRSSFHSVVIEDGITGLGQNLFIRYKNITSLTIAASVKDLAPSSFNSCKNLSEVEVKGAIPPDLSVGTFYGVKLNKATLIVPSGTKVAYETDPLWSAFGIIQESTLPAKAQFASVETLAEPCHIHLTRTTNFVGGGRNVDVILNGVDQGRLGNGKTIVMQTDRVHNELYIKQGKKGAATRRFDATAGEDIRISYSYFNAYMKITEEGNEELE